MEQQAMFTINNVWMMISIFLVFIMHLGFCCIETGLTRSKNTINILFKNIMVITFGLLTYAFWGFNLMYPGVEGKIISFSQFGLFAPEGANTFAYNEGYTYWTDFLFQGMFAATAATIVSGAVAERIKISAFLIFSLIYVGFVYPVAGYWHWGNGWLARFGFHDFAGSTIVHSVGGWAALVCMLILGPRIGKYGKSVKPIEGHNIPMATIGAFLLWFGWFGFNGGSVLSADPAMVSKVLVTTCIAACSGVIGAYITSYIWFKSLDLTMILNGILAGLVGITAGADLMSVSDSVWVGFISGILVVMGIVFIDKVKIDDPVGAVPVHLICGIWGTIAIGIFGDKAGLSQIGNQLLGVGSIALLCLTSSFVIFYTLKKIIGVRVSKKQELQGLDISEHKMNAYSDFRINTH